MAEAFGAPGTNIGDRSECAGPQREVNAEQASKRTMCRLTRQRYREG